MVLTLEIYSFGVFPPNFIWLCFSLQVIHPNVLQKEKKIKSEIQLSGSLGAVPNGDHIKTPPCGGLSLWWRRCAQAKLPIPPLPAVLRVRGQLPPSWVLASSVSHGTNHKVSWQESCSFLKTNNFLMFEVPLAVTGGWAPPLSSALSYGGEQTTG